MHAPKPIVIIGAGGFAQEVAWLIDDINEALPATKRKWNLLGFVDPIDSGRKEHYGLPILGNFDAVSTRFGEPFFVCGIGTPEIRKKETVRAEAEGWRPTALVHPSAFVAPTAFVGEGSTVGPACVVGPNVILGRHILLNVHVSIGHDSSIGDFCAISPGARILGNVSVADLVCVGANATVYPKRCMGRGSTLAANSFLHSDLAPGESVIGVAARPFLPQRNPQISKEICKTPVSASKN